MTRHVLMLLALATLIGCSGDEPTTPTAPTPTPPTVVVELPEPEEPTMPEEPPEPEEPTMPEEPPEPEPPGPGDDDDDSVVPVCVTALDTRARTDDISARANGGYTLSATGPATCKYIVAVSSESWLIIDDDGWSCHHAHRFNCRTTFRVLENATGAERTATIRIDGLEGQEKLIRQSEHRDEPPPDDPPPDDDGGDDGGGGGGGGGGGDDEDDEGGDDGGGDDEDDEGTTVDSGVCKTKWAHEDPYTGQCHYAAFNFTHYAQECNTSFTAEGDCDADGSNPLALKATTHAGEIGVCGYSLLGDIPGTGVDVIDADSACSRGSFHTGNPFELNPARRRVRIACPEDHRNRSAATCVLVAEWVRIQIDPDTYPTK